MPKSLYAALKKSDESSKKDNVFVKRSAQESKGISLYTDYQIKKYFLCANCEEKLQKHGENRVLREYYKDRNNFVLLDKVKAAPSLDAPENEKMINPFGVSGFYPDDYFYFGMSILWRASATKWGAEIDYYYNALGHKYQEQIRKYLNCESNFPDIANLVVYVANDDDGMVPPIIFPTVTKYFGYHRHEFSIPGIKFSFEIGSKLGESKKLFCALNTKILFVEYTFKNSQGFKFLSNEVSSKIIPKGRLAKDMNNANSLKT